MIEPTMSTQGKTVSDGMLWLRGNDLLRRLDPDSTRRLTPHLVPVELKTQEIIYKPGSRISEIYFPDTAVLCMLTIMSDGRSIEAATVGCEGASWVSASLGSPTMPCQTMVTVSGRAFKIASRHVEEEIKRNGRFHDFLSEYSHALLISSLRVGACNALHSLTQRSARWMLDVLDRRSDGHLVITQEFLAALLGCTRSMENTVLAEMDRLGAIRTTRGAIEIVDRARLEAAACECYLIIRHTYDEMRARQDRILRTDIRN
jgi:CRP-like cAMP-binding protein